MTLNNISFVPHGDADVDNMPLVETHKNLISNGNYSDATSFLDNNGYSKGMRASLFNSIQNKMRTLETHLLNTFNPEKDVYYSDTEPTSDFMEANGYKFWRKPY